MAIKRRGSEVDATINQKKVDFKKQAIRLKENESIRVRVLSASDYVEYDSHGSFNNGIYTQPCAGTDCPLCVASKHGGEDFKDLYIKPRFMFAFADLDTGEVRFWDGSKNQAQAVISQIQEYKEDLGEFAFNFKRTGSGTGTAYTLNLIPRLKKEDEPKFRQFDEEVVEDEFFDAICTSKTPKFIVKLLKEAGFPVEDHFSAELLADDELKPNVAVQPTNINDDEIPF